MDSQIEPGSGKMPSIGTLRKKSSKQSLGERLDLGGGGDLSFSHVSHAGNMEVGAMTIKLTVNERGATRNLGITNPTHTTCYMNCVLLLLS